MQGRPVGIAFDLDGTLLHYPLDTGAVRRRLGELFAPRGYRGMFEHILDGINEAAEHLGTTDIERQQLRRLGRTIVDEEEVKAANNARPLATVRPTVQGLNRRGFGLGIVTNSGRACLPRVLIAAGLADIPWRVANTRDEIEHHKPNPEALIGACRALTPDGGVVWYVGNSRKDVVCGQEANRSIEGVQIRTVAVISDRRGFESVLRGARPDHTIEKLEQLIPLVEGNW